MIRAEPAHNRRSLAPYLLWFTAWCVITVIGLILTPSADGHGTHRQLGFPPCPSVLMLGRPCPGCGLTTSWTSLLHGDLGHSIAAHPFGPLFYFGFTISAFVALWAYWRQKYFVYAKSFNVAMAAIVVVYLAFSVWRFIDPPPGYSRNPFAPMASARSGGHS